jgi:L-fuconolactonase
MTEAPVIIDAHHHIWDLAVRDQDWITGDDMAVIRRDFSVDDLRPLAAAAGVTATIMVQTVTVAEETPEMLAGVVDDPLVAGVVGWTDLTSPGIADVLAELRAGHGGDRLVGIRHQVQGEPDPDWLRRADVIRGLQAIADAGLAYDLVITPNQIPAAVYAAGAVPYLRFVLDHAGKPAIAAGELEAWAAPIRALALHPNVTCKLSGLVTQAGPATPVHAFKPYADVILDAFGPDRLMFGSDWPVCLLASTYPDVMDLTRTLLSGLDEHDKAAVFGTTAARVYRLPSHRSASTASSETSGGARGTDR